MQSILHIRRLQQRAFSGVKNDFKEQIHDDEKQTVPIEPAIPRAGKAVEQDPIIVEFDGPDDQDNPQNWPASKKAIVTIFLSAIGFVVGFGSSIDTPVIPQASEHFHISDVSESLATSLFLVGFGVGTPFAGPLSETFGRNPIYIVTMALFCCWILGAALAPDLGAQLTFRFLAGLFGGTPFTTSGGTMGDIFDHQTRGKAFLFFACVAFIGPMLGPVVVSRRVA